MISKRAIEHFRLDAKALRPLFEVEQGVRHPHVQRLVNRWRARAQQGRDRNLQEYKVYNAIDRSWEAGFRQTTESMIGMLRDLTQEGGKDTNAVAVAKEWGLTHLINETTDATSGKVIETLDFPVLQRVILSLPRSLTLMRVSRIMNERLQVPLMKFEAAYSNDEQKVRCEVGTQRIEQGNREFGYAATYAEAVQGAAKYGQQIMCVAEEWYSQNDYIETKDEQGNPVIQGVVGKEGLRYVLPHPSRSAIDIDWPAYQINNDVGPTWANYWRTTTFMSVKSAGYWNTSRISHSERFGDPKWQAYFQTTGQCRMAHTFENSQRFSPLDRERQLDGGTMYYTADQDDQPVWVTHHFERFNPKEAFGDAIRDEQGQPMELPDCEVWFRVVLASDDTPIYVTALPSCPVVYWPYEPVGGSSMQSSMMLELMPYGDHASNLLTQGLISLEQNLANINFYNEDIGLDKRKIETELKNARRHGFRKLVFFGFSGRKMLKQMTDMRDIFIPVRFPQMDVQNHLVMLRQLLEIMRQVVGMSDQEIGNSSSHEQSVEEIRTIHTATSQRAEFVAAWMDFAFESWKRQLWTYYMTYGTLRAYASLGPEFLALLDKLPDFSVESEPDSKGRVIVSCSLDNLRVEHFVAQRDGPNRIPWATIGGQMISFLQVFMGSQVAQAMQPQQIVKLINDALEALQFPKSFRIEMTPEQVSGAVSPAVQQFVQEQIMELVKQIKGFVDQEVKKGVEAVTPPEPPAPQQQTVIHNPIFTQA